MKQNIPILFFHGWGVDETVWHDYLAQHFADYKTHAPGMPVFGNKHNKSNENSKRDCLQLSQALTEPCVIVAWSLGAHVAVKLTGLNPDKVQKLILLNANPCFVKKEGWPYGVKEDELKKMMVQLGSSKEKTLSRFYTLITDGTDKQKELLKQLKNYRFSNSLTEHGLYRGLQILLREDMRRPLFELTVPIVMCFGERDSLIDRTICDDSLFASSGIETELLSGADHVPFLSQPKNTTDFISRHLV